MTIEQEIEWWRREYGRAVTRDLALVAFGVYAGLVLAKERIEALTAHKSDG